MTDPNHRWKRRAGWAVGLGALAVAVAVAAAAVGAWRWRGAAEPQWAGIEAAIEQKRWAEAEGELERWVARHPEDGKAWLRLGGVWTMEDRLDDALSAFQRVKGEALLRARAQTYTGEVRLKQHQAAEAERAFRAAAELVPDDPEPWRRLVYLLNLELRNDEARVVLWRLYQATHDPRHLLTAVGLSITPPDARDPSPELDVFLKQTPDDPILQRAQGLRLLRVGKPAEARPRLESALPAFPDDPAIRLALAECRLLMDEPKGIDAVLGPEPKSAADRGRWWLLRGEAAEAQGQVQAAIAAWRRAIAVDPENRAAHYRLGQALVRSGRGGEARPHLDRAEAIRLREVSLILALDRYVRGAHDADLLESLAGYCRDLGLLPEARAWFEQVIGVDPTRSTAQAALVQLQNVPEPTAVRLLARTPVKPPPAAQPPGAARSVAAASAPVRFRFDEVAAASGLSFQYDSGASGNLFIVDMMGGGVGLIDHDNDGWLDVYLVNGCRLPVDPKFPPAPNRLYRNRGDGTFEDVTERAGVGGRGYGMGCAVADYDNDGFDDLFVTGFGSTVLYRNRGDGRFEDVTERAGVFSNRWSTAAGFGDLDGDGDLDLYVVTYVEADPARADPCQDSFGHAIHCPPGHYPPQDDLLFRNNGNGTFTDISKAAGIEAPNGVGLGLAMADLDGDDRLDIFVANDAVPNFLFRNLGGLKFEEIGVPAGAACDGNGKATASMGVVADDLDGDGLIDLLHTNFVNESCTLLRNLGGGQFLDVTAQVGLAAPTRPMTGFGAVDPDLDNDGWPDLFLANGHVDDRPWDQRPMAQRPQLFANTGRGRFALVPETAAAYLARPVVARGAAIGDLDNDGGVDLLVVHRDAPLAVLRNTTPDRGHWLALRLVGTKSGRTPVGARVTCTAGGRKRVRWVTSGTSYLSVNDPRVWFGLGAAAQVERLEVKWPSGADEAWTHLAADRVLELREGEREIRNANPSPAAASESRKKGM